MVQANGSQISNWWGRHATVADRTDFWQIGPLRLWVQSEPAGAQGRVHLRWASQGDFLDEHVRSVPGALDSNGLPIQPQAGSENFACAYRGNARGEIRLNPALADRAVVTRLLESIGVLPGEDVTFYVVTPLWLRVELADGEKLLHEIPTYRLSDTWFGPVSNLGTLCYAGASDLYFDLRKVPRRSHCVTTAITIRNLGDDTLKLERLNIPFPRLSLFYSQNSGFWTDRIVLERREDKEMANLKLDRQPPSEAGPTQLVVGPRQSSSEASPVVRAFSAIFRERGQS